MISIVTYLYSVLKSEHLGRAYYELLGESIGLVPEIHATFVEADRLLRAAVERTIQSGIRAGDMPSDLDAKAFAVFIVALLRGTVMQWLLDPSGFDLVAVRGVIRGTFESAFLGRGPDRARQGGRRPTRSPQGREAAAQRGGAERSGGSRDGGEASEGGPLHRKARRSHG